MRVTEKGQVTIPKPIRDKLGIGPGSEVEFILRNGEVVIEARNDTAEDPETRLMRHIDRHAGSFRFEGMQADDVMRWLRD
jgi:AbrB family looped-hinge helix DNA binding protein